MCVSSTPMPVLLSAVTRELAAKHSRPFTYGHRFVLGMSNQVKAFRVSSGSESPTIRTPRLCAGCS